ncbi:hypothetical protein PR048_001082 [Dryococelus australis]|uniref:Uncharacterized protein n=1 Tax=Dryococelus australis TaxID=614101 RepID=A0ABQ9IGC4_9NEOP|nr:hypothetical protein PR048_001082 [Dryococelus australis]
MRQEINEVNQRIGDLPESLESCLAQFKEEVQEQNPNLIHNFSRQFNQLQTETNTRFHETGEKLHSQRSEVSETCNLVETIREEVTLQFTVLESRIEQVERRPIAIETREQEEVLRTMENRLPEELEQFSRHVDDKISLSSKAQEKQLKVLSDGLEHRQTPSVSEANEGMNTGAGAIGTRRKGARPPSWIPELPALSTRCLTDMTRPRSSASYHLKFTCTWLGDRQHSTPLLFPVPTDVTSLFTCHNCHTCLADMSASVRVVEKKGACGIIEHEILITRDTGVIATNVAAYWLPIWPHLQEVRQSKMVADGGHLQPLRVGLCGMYTCKIARLSREIYELQNKLPLALNTDGEHANPTKESKLNTEDETGGEDDHEYSIDDNDYDDGVDETDNDFLDALTHPSTTFAASSGMKQAEDVKNARYIFSEDPNELDRLRNLIDLQKSEDLSCIVAISSIIRELKGKGYPKSWAQGEYHRCEVKGHWLEFRLVIADRRRMKLGHKDRKGYVCLRCLHIIQGHGYRVKVMGQVQGHLIQTWWLSDIITWWLVGSSEVTFVQMVVDGDEECLQGVHEHELGGVVVRVPEDSHVVAFRGGSRHHHKLAGNGTSTPSEAAHSHRYTQHNGNTARQFSALRVSQPSVGFFFRQSKATHNSPSFVDPSGQTMFSATTQQHELSRAETNIPCDGIWVGNSQTRWFSPWICSWPYIEGFLEHRPREPSRNTLELNIEYLLSNRQDGCLHEISTYKSCKRDGPSWEPHVQGQEARERYGRHEHARLVPHRSYAQGVQYFHPSPECNDGVDGSTPRKPDGPKSTSATFATCRNPDLTSPRIGPLWRKCPEGVAGLDHMLGLLQVVVGGMQVQVYVLVWNKREKVLNNHTLYTIYQKNDNAKCHVSRATMQWYADNIVRLLEWPAQSPDLNPLEHIWDELDSRARLKSIAQLMEWLQEEWRQIPMDVLQTLVESMPDRVAAVLAAREAIITGASSSAQVVQAPEKEKRGRAPHVHPVVLHLYVAGKEKLILSPFHNQKMFTCKPITPNKQSGKPEQPIRSRPRILRDSRGNRGRFLIGSSSFPSCLRGVIGVHKFTISGEEAIELARTVKTRAQAAIYHVSEKMQTRSAWQQQSAGSTVQPYNYKEGITRCKMHFAQDFCVRTPAVANVLSGRRIVDIVYLFTQIQNEKHHGGTYCSFMDMDFVKEKVDGFQSTVCNIVSEIMSENRENKDTYMPINITAVHSILATGGEYSQLR